MSLSSRLSRRLSIKSGRWRGESRTSSQIGHDHRMVKAAVRVNAPTNECQYVTWHGRVTRRVAALCGMVKGLSHIGCPLFWGWRIADATPAPGRIGARAPQLKPRWERARRTLMRHLPSPPRPAADLIYGPDSPPPFTCSAASCRRFRTRSTHTAPAIRFLRPD
jgi:hypothetical protein